MQKQSQIRWRETEKQSIKELIKAFNRKIDYQKKKYPEKNNYLPQKVNFETFVNRITTRAELRKEINPLKRATKDKTAFNLKTNKNGVTDTKWNIRGTSIKNTVYNRQLKIERARIEALETTSQGKPTGITRGEMGSERLDNLLPRKIDFKDATSQRGWELFVESVDKKTDIQMQREKQILFKENYIKGLENAGYPEELIDMLHGIDAQQIVDTFYKEQEASIGS
jgi:hypothetical protein